jgi:hypothetical protein
VAIGAPSATPGIAIQTRVVWKRMMPAELDAALPGGLGVAIESAPDAYYAFLDAVARLETLTPRSPSAREAGESGGLERFRIRVQQIGSRRARTLEVVAESEPIARHLALAMAGRDWAITQLEIA